MFVWSCGRGRLAGRPAGRTSGWTSGRTVVGGVRAVSGAEKKVFDRGGPVWLLMKDMTTYEYDYSDIPFLSRNHRRRCRVDPRDKICPEYGP